MPPTMITPPGGLDSAPGLGGLLTDADREACSVLSPVFWAAAISGEGEPMTKGVGSMGAGEGVSGKCVPSGVTV